MSGYDLLCMVKMQNSFPNVYITVFSCAVAGTGFRSGLMHVFSGFYLRQYGNSPVYEHLLLALISFRLQSVHIYSEMSRFQSREGGIHFQELVFKLFEVYEYTLKCGRLIRLAQLHLSLFISCSSLQIWTLYVLLYRISDLRRKHERNI